MVPKQQSRASLYAGDKPRQKVTKEAQLAEEFKLKKLRKQIEKGLNVDTSEKELLRIYEQVIDFKELGKRAKLDDKQVDNIINQSPTKIGRSETLDRLPSLKVNASLQSQ